MRDELREVKKILKDNGWVQTVEPAEGEMAEFVKGYGDNTVGIEIALHKCSRDCYGSYGVGCIQICRFEAPMPYIRDDLRQMQRLICDAEKELVKIGVPFRPTYGFGECLEYLLGKNIELREKYNLAVYEKEDFG